MDIYSAPSSKLANLSMVSISAWHGPCLSITLARPSQEEAKQAYYLKSLPLSPTSFNPNCLLISLLQNILTSQHLNSLGTCASYNTLLDYPQIAEEPDLQIVFLK